MIAMQPSDCVYVLSGDRIRAQDSLLTQSDATTTMTTLKFNTKKLTMLDHDAIMTTLKRGLIRSGMQYRIVGVVLTRGTATLLPRGDNVPPTIDLGTGTKVESTFLLPFGLRPKAGTFSFNVDVQVLNIRPFPCNRYGPAEDMLPFKLWLLRSSVSFSPHLTEDDKKWTFSYIPRSDCVQFRSSGLYLEEYEPSAPAEPVPFGLHHRVEPPEQKERQEHAIPNNIGHTTRFTTIVVSRSFSRIYISAYGPNRRVARFTDPTELNNSIQVAEI